MKVIYYKKDKAIYIELRDIVAGEIDYSEELTDDILIDKTKSGEIVGIACLNIESIEEYDDSTKSSS